MKQLIIKLIKLYQKLISPIFHRLGYECKFYPSCSQYTIEAIIEYGIIKGCFLGIKRIMRCNPFSKGGYDPLKKIEERK